LGGGAVLLGETASPSLAEVLLTALRLAQAFSLGGGAGITFSGSLGAAAAEELVEGGRGEAPGEEASSSRPLNTSSTDRSLSRRREPGPGQGEPSFQTFQHILESFTRLYKKAGVGRG